MIKIYYKRYFVLDDHKINGLYLLLLLIHQKLVQLQSSQCSDALSVQQTIFEITLLTIT